MSAWRRKAIEWLPDLKRVVSEAPSPMALWIELLSEFDAAFRVCDADKTDRILKYARWCWQGRNEQAVIAVKCAFFEHLPLHRGMCEEIPRWFSRAEFDRLRPVFGYHADSEVIADIEESYRTSGVR